MPYCSQCGVEVDNIVEKCPLCQMPIQKTEEPVLPVKPYPEKAAGSPPLPPLTLGEKMTIARIITTICFLIPILFVTAIDYFINGTVTWSAIADLSLISIWLITLISLFSWKKTYLLIFLIHLDLGLYLLILNGFISGSTWIIPAGIPILIWSWLLVTLTLFIISRLKTKGANVAALILLTIGFICTAIDLTLQYIYHENLEIGWSLIVFSVMLPTAILLFYLQSPRFSHSRIRRFLHF